MGDLIRSGRVLGISDSSCGIRESFFGLLLSLLNFRVKILTEGDNEFVRGILTDVNRDFVTLSGREIFYIPVRQIVIVKRDECFD